MPSEKTSEGKVRKIVLWNADAVGEGRSSIQVLLDWLSVPGHYDRWKSSNLTVKNDAAQEILKILNEEGITHRNIGHIYNKIGDLERSYIKSRAKVNVMEAGKGNSMMDRGESIKLLSRHCKHYLILDPIMREHLTSEVTEAMKDTNVDSSYQRGGDSNIMETSYASVNHNNSNISHNNNNNVLDNDQSLPFLFPTTHSAPEPITRLQYNFSSDSIGTLSSHFGELVTDFRKYQQERLAQENKRIRIEENRLEFEREIFKKTCLQKDLDLERSRLEVEKMKLDLAIARTRAPTIIADQASLDLTISQNAFPSSSAQNFAQNSGENSTEDQLESTLIENVLLQNLTSGAQVNSIEN